MYQFTQLNSHISTVLYMKQNDRAISLETSQHEFVFVSYLLIYKNKHLGEIDSTTIFKECLIQRTTKRKSRFRLE